MKCSDFLSAPGPLFDVRSPVEYLHSHIPGACSLPLFSDEERAQVGTVYKREGKQPAISLGLKMVGPKIANLAEMALKWTPEGIARVYCWRGGMRSNSMAWLLRTAGLQVQTLEGGYKKFRRHVLETLSRLDGITFTRLGGMTGSGKTDMLHTLQQRGEQILDLEALAHHCGSAFGGLGMPPQPSTEQFENKIAVALNQMDFRHNIWIEDESRMIGTCKIPDSLFNAMQKAEIVIVEASREERIQRLIRHYGPQASDQLIAAVSKLHRRLGGARTKQIVECLQAGEPEKAVSMLLDYYDQSYTHALRHKSNRAAK